MELNSQQAKAVAINEGPALIIAGAGTGKTSVIVQRILRLINDGTPPERILALTFTEKAASEMIERVSLQSSKSLFSMPIYTFNGFGAAILDEFAIEIGLASPMRLLGESGQLVFMRDNLDKFELDYFSPVSRPDSQLTTLQKYFSTLKQHVVLPNDYIAFASKMPAKDESEALEKAKHQELANAYKSYIDLCRQQHVIDYDDQIFLTLELLQKRPNIRQKIAKRFDYIIVDEFQDTNTMQSTLLDAIVGDTKSIMAVGDDDQSIYGWRGATLQNILSFSQRYNDTTNIVLQDNYRSTQSILDAAYSLIQNNNPDRLEHTTGLSKKLVSQSGKGTLPCVLHFAHQQSELQWIASDIKKRLDSGQDPASIAILARRNADVALLHEALTYNDVPHAVVGTTTNVFDTLAVKQLVQLLSAVLNPHDNTAVYHAFSSAAFDIDAILLAKLSHTAKQENTSLYELIAQSQDSQLVSAYTLFNSWVSNQQSQTVGDIAYAIITESGWTKRLYNSALTQDVSAIELQGLGLFFELLREFTKTSNHPTLAMFIESLPLLKSSIADIKDDSELVINDRVCVMSIHKSKGLEWDTVYIFNCNEGTMPLTARGGSLTMPIGLIPQSAADDHTAEERRLMYVAITRAAKNLTICYSDTKTGNRTTKPSRFIAEMGSDNLQFIDDNNTPQSDLIISSLHQGSAIAVPDDIKQGNTYVLSVSQVTKWLQCPQEFYYLYVLKTPQKPDPTTAYGTLIHACIERLHKANARGENISIEDMQKFYDESWPKAGYFSAKQRDRAKLQGQQTLQKLYERFIQSPAPVKTEHKFKVAIPQTNVVLKGRIDAVFSSDKGDVIVDYKTGTGTTDPQKANKKASASPQLTMYALAWQLTNDELPAALVLDFVETSVMGRVTKKQQSIDTMIQKISNISQQLDAGNYPEGDHTYCTHPY